MSKLPRNTYWLYRNEIKNAQQHIKKFFILDFEATCDIKTVPEPQEIIEFPCLMVNSNDYTVESKFHRYVQPKVHPCLSSYCTTLTGIHQEDVDNEPEFPEVFADFVKWLEERSKNVSADETIFVTCGNWDLKSMLPRQCKQHNLEIPSQMKRWINIKTAFFQGTGFYPRGLEEMFRYLNEKMTGRLHSGIDDCYNIYHVLTYLARCGLIFEETDSLD